jgi:hypothetical protein
MHKGAIHIHSTYSDGELTLVELRDAYVAAGCAFACMTDHAEYFDPDRRQRYVAECAALSDEGFRFIPGLEFRCPQKLHILGLGVTALLQSDDPGAVIAHIEASGGVSIVAHPRDQAFASIEAFDLLPDGVETWNSKYDGRYAPRLGTFDLLGRLQQRRPDMRAFYGQDLHWKRQFRGLFLEVDADRNLDADILGALARGDYVGRNGPLTLPSHGHLPEVLRQRLRAVHQRSDFIRRLGYGAKRLADRIGVRVPTPFKARLRGIF